MIISVSDHGRGNLSNRCVCLWFGRNCSSPLTTGLEVSELTSTEPALEDLDTSSL